VGLFPALADAPAFSWTLRYHRTTSRKNRTAARPLSRRRFSGRANQTRIRRRRRTRFLEMRTHVHSSGSASAIFREPCLGCARVYSSSVKNSSANYSQHFPCSGVYTTGKQSGEPLFHFCEASLQIQLLGNDSLFPTFHPRTSVQLENRARAQAARPISPCGPRERSMSGARPPTSGAAFGAVPQLEHPKNSRASAFEPAGPCWKHAICFVFTGPGSAGVDLGPCWGSSGRDGGHPSDRRATSTSRW
jgi:hypothetical protein